MKFNDFYLNENEAEVGFLTDIEKDTNENTNFREVLWTGQLQLVLMALKPGEDIGEEIHEPDQFFRVDGGSGKLIIKDKEYEIKDGSAFIIPGGTKHNIIASDKGLKVYAIYAPPQHEDGTIHKTKEEAVADEKEEHGENEE
ncbi:MAG: cupin domain-containing protein [Elusimicrobiota bacterium]